MIGIDQIVLKKLVALLDYEEVLKGNPGTNQGDLGAVQSALRDISDLVGQIYADPAKEPFRLADIDLILNGLLDIQKELVKRVTPPSDKPDPQGRDAENPLREITNRLVKSGYPPKGVPSAANDALKDTPPKRDKPNA